MGLEHTGGAGQGGSRWSCSGPQRSSCFDSTAKSWTSKSDVSLVKMHSQLSRRGPIHEARVEAANEPATESTESRTGMHETGADAISNKDGCEHALMACGQTGKLKGRVLDGAS